MSNQQAADSSLRQEIMLQVNERLYIQGSISKTLYEQAKVKIVEREKGAISRSLYKRPKVKIAERER